jgi:hypothetical protein
VLVELDVVEQRYRAVLEVSMRACPLWWWRAGMGWPARRCMPGCAGMPMGVAWVGWRTGPHGRPRARIR